MNSTEATPIDSERLLQRFLRYVRVDTTANPDTTDYPSSPGQMDLGKLLVSELAAMGAQDVNQDEHGLVWATVPATVKSSVPNVLFNAHLDTSPESPGKDVAPQVIRGYTGGDIPLPDGKTVIRVDDCPALLGLVGHTLITTDGTTLLGGDDKAGVASIMELVEHLLENPHLPHGTVRILFTCDEEIGRGAQHMNLDKANAAAAYTLDGSGHAHVENENFSADQLTVRAMGNNIHPSIAKGRMVNAARGLAQLIARLPLDHSSPESTDGRLGFLHPYSISGGVDAAEVKILLRDFDTLQLDDYAHRVRRWCDEVQSEVPGLQFEIERVRQYRNMADALKKSPQVVDFALQAFESLGHQPQLGAIRGGTDGAIFSELGLPTPNLSVGQHNIHSVREFASLDEMTCAVQHAIKLLELWQTHLSA